MIRRPRRSTLFPYTTLSRSEPTPPLKATHTATSGKPGSSSSRRRPSERGPKPSVPRRTARGTALGRGFGKHAEAGDLGGARVAQLIARHGVELVQITGQRRLEAGGGSGP